MSGMRIGRTFVDVMPKPVGVHRILQRAGTAKPERWRDGFALRLPWRRLLVVVWRCFA